MDKIVLDQLSFYKLENDIINRDDFKAHKVNWAFTQGQAPFEQVEINISVTTARSPLSFINLQDLQNRGKKIRITIDEVDI